MSNQEIRYLIKNELEYLKFKNANNYIYKQIYLKFKDIINENIYFLSNRGRNKYIEKLYCYLNNIKEIPMCKCCFLCCVDFNNFDSGYKEFCCSPCRAYGTVERVHKTNIIRYGCKFPQQNKIVREKTIKTNNRIYGSDSPTQNEKVVMKTKNTNNKRYGGNAPANNEVILLKMQKTCKDNYGVKNPYQIKEIREKAIKTYIEKYGGFENISALFKEKREQTNLKRHGYIHSAQNADIFMKSIKNSHRTKNYITSSGNIRRVQGYEPFALDILLETYEEQDIETSVKYMPKIWYYTDDNRKHRYYPDIFIKSENRFIEVKSRYTYENQKDLNLLKQKATKDLGLKHEIWIISEKGEILEIIS